MTKPDRQPPHEARSDVVLEYDALVKRLGTTTALAGVSFTCSAGSITALIGPNGAGKSTLFLAASGLLVPDAGTVRVRGHPAGSAAAQRAVSLMPEQPDLFALFVGLQLLALDRVGEQDALDPSLLDPVLRFAPLLLAAALFFSTFSTPLRLQVADVSWVRTAPGGGRALFARALLLRPLGYAAIGYLGASIARWSLGRRVNEVWKIALVAAAAGLALRLTTCGSRRCDRCPRCCVWVPSPPSSAS